VLADCIAGRPPKQLPAALQQDPCARALFGVLVEGLADRFDPALCEVYARLFSDILPGADLARYQRIRRPRAVIGNPRRVLVLSRVTLGADIAVTSVLIDAAKRRFPKAKIFFVGPHKNFELFAADRRLTHAPLEYRRGTLQERLAAAHELESIVGDGLVLDPDSRLTQLGLLAAGDESRHHLFESRAYGSETSLSLPELASQWCTETLGLGGSPYLSPVTRASGLRSDCITVNLGVGENPGKRLPDPFEEQLLALLASRAPVTIDRGAGGEESARVDRAVRQSGAEVSLFEGSFAEFAKIIAASKLYVGYDSAGQHAAAAAGVPLISIFAGFAVPRMFDRWRPVAPGATVIRVDTPDPVSTLERVRAALMLAPQKGDCEPRP
jgi:hypothetical protein